MVYSPLQGRLAQRESAAFTRQRSLVRTQHRPLEKVLQSAIFQKTLLLPKLLVCSNRAESVSEEAKQVRHALHEVPHAPIHARRPDSHENLAVSDLGPFDVPEFEDVGWAVFFLDDRFRGVSPFFDVA